MRKFNFLSKTRWLLVPLILLTFGIGQMWGAGTDAVYTFSTSAGCSALDISYPSSDGKYTELSTTGYTVGQITMTVTHGSGTSVRVYNSSGTVRLRLYNGNQLTFTAASGYKLNSITFGNSTNNISASVGSISGTKWTAPSNTTSVTFTKSSSGNTQNASITVNYESTGGSTYTITYADTNGEGSNGSYSASSTSSIASGTTITLTPTPADCYELNAWDVYRTGASGTKVSVSNNQFTMPAYNVTVGATFSAKGTGKTVNFDAQAGIYTGGSLTEDCEGSGITLPSATASGICKGWTTFAGWATSAVNDSTTTNPGTLYAKGNTYYPASDNMTLYAVYSKNKSGGSTSTTIAPEDLGVTTQNAIGTKTVGSITFKGELGDQGTSTNVPKYYSGSPNTIRCYASNDLTISSTDQISQIDFTYNGSYSGGTPTPSVGSWAATPTTGWNQTWKGSSTSIKFRIGNSQWRITNVKVTTGGGSTTYYCSDPNCCTPYTVTIKDDNGSVTGGTYDATPKSACEGTSVTLSKNVFTGYTFGSWTVMNGQTPVEVSNDAFTMPAANVTVQASFTPKHHNVVFHKNDGGEDETNNQDYTYGVAQNLKTIATIGWTRSGYNFGGWMTSASGEAADYADGASYTLSVDNTVDLYALWVADNTRTIAYSGDEHINYSSKPTSVAQDAANFTASFSLATGYELKGVTATMGGVAIAAEKIAFTQSSLTITAPTGGFTDNIAVTFNVAEIKYTVTFHAGTGSCATESLTQGSYGAAIELPSATIGAQGWSFVGWAEASVASATSVAPTLHTESFTPTDDDDLYAVYRKTITEGGTNQVQFTYDSHEGWDGTAAGVSGNNPYFLLEGSEYMESPEIADMSKISSIEVSVGKYNNKGAYSITGGGTGIATGGIPSTTGANGRTILKANFSNTLSGAGKIRITNTDGASGSGTRLYAMTINIDVAAVYSYHSTPASATGLAVQVAPTKTVYKVGDTFDPAGTTLRVTYSNSTTEDITSGYTYSPTTALTKENTSVTFSYLGLNCNQAISVLDPVATPTFSPASGSEVSVSETITISCETASATIYYTTDGSDPTNTSAVYSTPIAPYSTIKAIAMKADMAPSEIATATYTVVKNSQTLTFTQPSYSFRLNSDEYNAFEHQAVSGAVTTVTYSSSNTAVADIEGGVVVLKGGKGTATITATAAETATYSSASATYTITVLREGATRIGDFKLVTNANQLEDGDYILLTSSTQTGYNENPDYAYVFSGITSSAGTSQSKNVINDEITYAQLLSEGNTAKIIYLEKVGDYWAFNYGTDDDIYIAAGTSTGSSAAALRGLDKIDNYCKWDISIGEGNVANVNNQGNATYYALSFNGTAIKSYKQLQGNSLRIYKQKDKNKLPQTLSFATPSYEFPLNESAYTSFAHQTVSGAHTAVTYTSNNDAVAVINNNTVVLNGGVGTATITATAAESEDYEHASATYTITVTAALNTVTFHYYKAADATADQTALKEASSGAGITVPAKPANVGEYTFLGWAPATLVETQTTPDNIVAALQAGATYHPYADGEEYYAIYRRLENSDGRFYLKHNSYYAQAPASSTSTNLQNTNKLSEAAVFGIDGDKFYYYEGSTKRYISSVVTSGSTAEKRVLSFTTDIDDAKAWSIVETATNITLQSSFNNLYLYHNGNLWAAYASLTESETVTKDLTKVYLAKVYYTSTPNKMVSPVLTWAHGNEEHVMEIDATYDNAATATVGGEPVSVTYSSSDETKATVNEAGVVTAHLGGLVTITATVAENPGVSRALVETYQVSITKKVPVITFDDEANYQVYVGEAYKRVLADNVSVTTDGAVTYTLSNNATASDYASINTTTGEVTGLTSGGSVIQYLYVHTEETDMYQAGEANHQFQVLALKNQPLAFGQNAYVFDMNESVDAFVNTLSGAYTTVAYTSNNTDVAEVDSESGEVTVHTNVCGTATITATAAEGQAGDNIYREVAQTYTITVNYPKPVFSMETSEIKAPVSLSIAGYDNETKLYYTDGEGDPNTLYSEPLAISETKTIRAKATSADGSLVSPIATVTLTKVVPVVNGAQDGGTITLSSDDNSLITYIILNQNGATVAEGSNVASPVVFNTELSGTYTVEATATWDVENGFTGAAYENDLVIKGKGHLPINYTGNGSGLDAEPWATKVGTLGDYNSDPKIQFKNEGCGLIAAFVEKPVQLSYQIKHNRSNTNTWEAANNVYKVQWSADGDNYYDIKVYNSSNPMSNEITEEQFDLDASARYVKWVYTTKNANIGGNVALGNIQITCEAIVIDGVNMVDIPENYDGDVIVENGVTWEPEENEVTEINNLWIKQGAVVDVTDAMLSVNDVILESQEGYSGQILEADNFEATGNAYYDLTLNTSGTMDNSKWYAFAVPFQVDAATGIQRLSNDGVASPAGFNSHYVLLKYNSAAYASDGQGWEYVNAGETLEPGKFYMIALNSNVYNRVRMTKKAGAAVNNKADLTLSLVGTGVHANWNALANNALAYANVSATGDNADLKVQVYNSATDNYTPYAYNKVTFTVGTPFFLQAAEAGTMSVNIAASTNETVKAPQREAQATEEFQIRLGENTESYYDILYVSASDEALNEYQIGHDLAKAGVSTSVPQMYVPAYGAKLCDAEFPLVDNEATFPLTFTAPNAGTYHIYVAEAAQDAELYLLQNNSIVWNLTLSPYEIALPQGTTEGYSLLLKAKAPNTATGVDEVQSDNVQCTKVVIDDHVYILRGGKMYGVDGKEVR